MDWNEMVEREPRLIDVARKINTPGPFRGWHKIHTEVTSLVGPGAENPALRSPVCIDAAWRHLVSLLRHSDVAPRLKLGETDGTACRLPMVM